MESRVFDPTLPLDFDGSTKMTDLPDITLGNNPSNHDLQESVSHTMSPGPSLRFPMVAKSNSGRMSPVRGRTMKEYDQQITELKKENFSLKLRIYFLEERMQQKYGDGEDVFKTNIELKVNVQSLKKELEDKQELLRKASQAMETLTSSQQSDIDSVKKSLEEQHHKYTEELRSDLQKALQDAEDARDELEVGRDRMNQLEVQLQQMEMELHQSNVNTQKLKDAMEMKEREVSALQLESDSQVRSLEDAQRLLQDMEAERDAAQQRMQRMEKDLQRRGRDVEQLSTALKDTSMIDGQSFLAPSHLQDVVDDQRDNLSRLEVKVTELEDALKNKDDLIGKLEDGLKEKDKAWKDAANRLEQLNRELEQEKQLGNRRDKTIQGLVGSLHKKEKEVTSAKSRLSKSETALKTLRAELHEAEMASHQDQLQQLNDQLADSENSNRRLQIQLDDANTEVENMIRSLGKKEGELAGFRDQLQQANQALKRSEEALEALQEQLEKERTQAHSRLDRQTQDYQRTLEDYMQQLEGKDSLMAHMTAQMHAKDKQLTSLMDLLTDETNKGQKVLLQRLEDDMNQSAGSAQSALEEKQSEIDRKGRELREARQALQDKGRELEQAHLKVLDRQEELERLELNNRHQAEAAAQLSTTVARAQQSLEDALDKHAQALQDKDAIVQRLQKALAEKEHMLEEVSQQSPSADKQQQQLRAQLRDKDQLIQELQTECVKASCEKEQAAHTWQTRLQEKEEEMQALNQKQQKELLNRDQEIQGLVSQLGKKDLQLQGLESRLKDAEAQHREAVQSLRKMLAEKDKTIAALVDSVGEKEQLLRRSQQNMTEDAKAQMAEMDTLLSENSRLKRLLREKEEALQEEQRQRTGHHSGDSYHSSRHSTVHHTNNVDNSQVCRLLEEQIRETRKLSDLLHPDHNQVVVNLTTDHTHSHTHTREGEAKPSEAALQAELSAVSNLRQRLLEGVERTQQLHRSLLGHTVRQGDQLTSGESSPDSDQLSSLDSHLPAQRAPALRQLSAAGFDEIDGCPGPSSSGATHTPVSGLRVLQDAAKVTPGQDGGHKTLAVQTSPLLTHTLDDDTRTLVRERREVGVDTEDTHMPSGGGEGSLGQTTQDNSSRNCLQAVDGEMSQDALSRAASLSSGQLAGMSAAVLRDLVSQLQEDATASAQHNSRLHRQLEGDSGKAGTASSNNRDISSTAAVHLQAQVDSLLKALKQKDEETAKLREQIGLPTHTEPWGSSTLSHRHSDLADQSVHSAAHHSRDMEMNSGLPHPATGSAGGDLSQDGVSSRPGLLTQMERLKADNARLSRQLEETLASRGMEVKEGGVVSHTREVHDGNGMLSSEALWKVGPRPSDVSQPSPGSPGFSMLSCSEDLSHNTNRHTDSALSQHPGSTQWGESFARSVSQSSHSDSEWVPRVMQGEGQVGGRLPPLAKKGLNNNSESASNQPLVSVGRRLHESQEQVKSLEERLLATEGTVRYMSQRLRHYRSLLQASKGGKGAVVGLGLPRSQSESSLCPQSRLSLSLSCSDLHEAAQCSGGMGPAYSSSTYTMGDPSSLRDVQSTETLRVRKEDSSGQRPRAIVNTLNQHIKAIRDRYSQDGEGDRPGVGRGEGQSRTPLDEDGGSTLSCLSPQPSAESLRRDALSALDIAHAHRGSRMVEGVSDTTTLTLSEASGPDWTYSQNRHCVPSTSLAHHSNTTTSTLLPETTFSMTLGEDLPDCTVLDNLTYSSFSESILPMGSVGGQQDSAWGLCGQGNVRQGRHDVRDVRVVRDNSQATGSSEGGSSGDEAACDGNGTHSGEGSAQTESSRLKARVMVLTDMNRTLREELSVYDTLCRSMGVQVSAEGISGLGSRESSGEESSDGEMRLLQLHLSELKRLRARLEQLDTEAHNAVQVTSLLNSQHIKRITELEAALANMRAQLADFQNLASQRQTTIIQHERLISETNIIREHQEKETQLLRDNLAALQDCENQRAQQHQAEVEELQQQLAGLRREVEEAQQQAKDLEQDLEDSQQRRQSCDVKFSRSQQHLLDLETQLSKAKRRVKGVEAELHKAQQTSHDLETQLTSVKERAASLETDLRISQQSSKKLEVKLAESASKLIESTTRLTESTQQLTVLETKLTLSEKARSEQEKDLTESRESLQSLEEELGRLRQQKEEVSSGLLMEKEHSKKLEQELSQVQLEKQQLEKQASESGALREECKQQQQRAQHYQERMAHYEECMRDYQHRVQDCESQVEQLKGSLQDSQSKEQDTGSQLHQAHTHIQHLQNQLKDAESRAHTNENIAHRADTLARTLEGRLRELEAKVKDTEDRARDSEYELRVSHSATSELNISLETVKKDLAERNTKLKKRDAQLKKLVEEYKKVLSSQKETSQLNQTLKTEIKLYETMTCQTEVSRDKKEELMRQLLSELSQTRRLAEDLISRLEHNKRNDSPASTGGSEAADGRPSPEPRDSLHSLLSEANILRVHTETHHSTAESHASSVSEHMESPPDSTPLSSPGSGTFSCSKSRPRAMLGRGGPHSEDSRTSLEPGQSASTLCGTREGGGVRGVEDVGPGHLRSFSHPTSLKYWRDHPHSSMSGASANPKVEVDSDVRRLFAISGLEGYEKLRRENGELMTTLSAMQARMTERLKSFTGVSISESVEYSTLRELQMSAQNLRICAEEEGRLLSCFWLTQLPPLNARGEFYDPKLSEENENLKVELRKQKSRYDLLAHTVREQQERLHATNALRKKWETTLYKQYEHFLKHELTSPALRAAATVPPFVSSFSDDLEGRQLQGQQLVVMSLVSAVSHTNGILEQSKENFEEAGMSPPKSKPPRKSPAQPIRDKN